METNLYPRAAKLIKAAMDKRELTCAKVAQAISCAEMSIYHWREGIYIPSKWAIPGLAKVLKISEKRLRDAVDADKAERKQERSGSHSIISGPEGTEPGTSGAES